MPVKDPNKSSIDRSLFGIGYIALDRTSDNWDDLPNINSLYTGSGVSITSRAPGITETNYRLTNFPFTYSENTPNPTSTNIGKSS